jgi:molybdopterin molybdotransferase
MYLEEKSFIPPGQVMAELFKRWMPKLRIEYVPLVEAAGRVCAEDLFSKNTLPVVRCAFGDGIAVRSADFALGPPDPFNWVKGVNYTMADTGDDFDDPFDTVIPVESLNYNTDGTFTFVSGLKVEPGQRVGPRGKDIQQGELVLKAGTKITPQQLWTTASGGHTQVPVFKKPVVAFIPSGNELIDVGETPLRGQNIQSCGVMLGATLRTWGAEMVEYPIVRDDKVALEAALNKALSESDIVMVSGGTSKGSEDFTARMIGVRSDYFQHGVQVAPGRPTGIGLIDGKPVINLPGPPYGAFTVLDWCVRKLVYRASGTEAPKRVVLDAELQEDLNRPPFPYLFIVRLHLIEKNGKYQAWPLWFGKRNADASILCNGLLFMAPGDGGLARGDTIKAELLYDLA